jgi:hypothetical protein
MTGNANVPRARRYDADDAPMRADLGLRGTTAFGYGYAWCERERAYHYNNDAMRTAINKRPFDAVRFRALPKYPARMLPSSDVRTVALSIARVNAFYTRAGMRHTFDTGDTRVMFERRRISTMRHASYGTLFPYHALA